MSDSEKLKFFKNMRSMGLNSEKNFLSGFFRLVSQANLGIQGLREFNSLANP